MPAAASSSQPQRPLSGASAPMENGSPDRAGIVEFILQAADLGQYCNSFISSEYDTMEVMLVIGADDFQRIGVLAGHTLKISLALQRSHERKQVPDHRQRMCKASIP